MRLCRRGNSITIWAPAKLNLFLEVLGKRPDGFHEIESLYSAVSIYDTLTFEATPNGPVEFSCRWCQGHCSQAQLPGNEQNLALRALRLLRDRYAVKAGARVNLLKRIPTEAGLGGASSDAAAALAAGNFGWQLSLSRTCLSQLAGELGSDVPFFLHQSPAVCQGRGEQVRAARYIRRHYVVVKPPGGLSTKAVYNACRVPVAPHRIEPHGQRPLLFNRLEGIAISMSPDVARVAKSFEKVGVLDHQLTGSGAAYFGVCQNRRHALRVANQLRQLGWAHVHVAMDVVNSLEPLLAAEDKNS